MKIISHRGYWRAPCEKNSLVAFRRSFELGFGTETDVRDHKSRLVISHDIPKGGEILLQDFFDLVLQHTNGIKNFKIALNIKSDGLAAEISKILSQYQMINYFLFDMSVPDMRGYIFEKLKFYTRVSEVERNPAWLENAAGVWVDSFESIWYETNLIEDILKSQKEVCIVSPELHNRPFIPLWEKIKPLILERDLVLCTDYPEHAQAFFFGEGNGIKN